MERVYMKPTCFKIKTCFGNVGASAMNVSAIIYFLRWRLVDLVSYVHWYTKRGVTDIVLSGINVKLMGIGNVLVHFGIPNELMN